jgi:hypothetical protein
MYAEVMEAQGLDVSHHKSADDGESVDLRYSKGASGVPSAAALDSIRGKTKKLNGELKPIR